MEKLLSIIIPIDDWRSDDEKDLQAGVECLLNQNIPKEELELVFVVGQNDSKISDILQSYSNTYLNMVRVTDSDASSMVNTASGKYALFYDFRCVLGSCVCSAARSFLSIRAKNARHSRICTTVEHGVASPK